MAQPAPLPPLEAVLARDARALAKLLRAIDDNHPGAGAALEALYNHAGRACVIGITGYPGAGKSTLVNALIREARAAGKSAGVLAIDPSSPFSGGAILGDRIRMTEHSLDPGVFIRSLATRGQMGGLSASAADMCTVLDAAGYDVIIVETVGVGQDEIDIVHMAAVTVVVLTPGGGDEIQSLKAGILEIADVFAVNKAEREGADRLVADLESMIGLSHPEGRTPPRVMRTTATDGTGVKALFGHIMALAQSGGGGLALESKRRARFEALLRRELLVRAYEKLNAAGVLGAALRDAATGAKNPYTAAAELAKMI